ncbi:MAG: bifunctional DNA primase/polymerase [Phycisphaerae bacterium]
MTSDNGSPPSASNTESPLAANVRLGHGMGWSFTPLAGKRPTLEGWQKRPRETLEEALAWAAQGNVGLRTGRVSGMVVIDIDPGADVSGLDLPGTVTALTGRPGAYHLYYLCDAPLGNSSGRLGPHIDVRGDGGQVVFPGSVHPDTGALYTWAEGHEPWNVEVAVLPAEIIERLRAKAKPKAAPVKDAPADGDGATARQAGDIPAKAKHYAQTALKMELHAVSTAAAGSRNETLNKAAFSLGTLVGGGYLERVEVEEALMAAAGACGLVDDPDDGPERTRNTIRSGLQAGMAQPRHLDLPDSAAKGGSFAGEYILTPGPHKDDDDNYVERSNADFAGEVLDALPADAIYRRDFIPGEIIGPAGKRKWTEFSVDRMRILVDSKVKLGKWVTSRQDKEQVLLYQACSKDNAGLVVAHAQSAPGVRDLHLMVAYPFYGPDFVRIGPGWRDGLYYDEPEDLRDLVPETDCEVIHNVLHDLVVDFPFKTPADRENFFGLLLTPIIAPAIDGNRPMHLMNAPIERTGKSKLVNEVMGLIITGRDTPSMQITEREEEREKRILAMLLQGETLMHLDNLPPYIDSPALASLLTTKNFLGRVLGFSRNVSLPNNLTIIGTGNNVQTSGEIAKRIVPIMIEPTSANPEARTDFQHPDIRAYARQQRRTVLECLLGLVENWLAANRPLHADRLGGFESWSETVGGILQVNGLRKWRTNEAEWRQRANPGGSEMEAFVRAWHEGYGSQEVEPKDLRELARSCNIFGHVFAKQTDAAINVAFGRLLSRHTDMPVASWYIRRSGPSNHVKYFLKEIK